MRYKLFSDTAKVPVKADEGSAGYDLYGDNGKEIWIMPHHTEVIGTGIGMEIPMGTFGAILPRSGVATKRGLRPANTPGCIDPSYRGEIKIALHNDTDEPKVVEPHERIAQIVFIPYSTVPTWEQADDLSETERGAGGFGHSGTT